MLAPDRFSSLTQFKDEFALFVYQPGENQNFPEPSYTYYLCHGFLMLKKELPSIEATEELKEFADRNNYFYVEKSGMLYFLNPLYEEYQTVVAPVYVTSELINGMPNYTYTGTSKKQNIPTEKMLKKAYEYFEELKKSFKDSQLPKKQILFDEIFLANSFDNGCSAFVDTPMLLESDINTEKYLIGFSKSTIDNHFKGIVIHKDNIKNVALQNEFNSGRRMATIRIPGKLKGSFIGKNGHHLKEINKKLDISIHVCGIYSEETG